MKTTPGMMASMFSAAILATTVSDIIGPRYGGSSGPSLKGDELRAARDRKKRQRKNKKRNR